MQKSEFAQAKINLTLEVLGRRPDGYHEIRSLVAFAADVGDRLSLGPQPYSMTEVTGPFADGLSGGNLVDRAVVAVLDALPNLGLGRVTLEKNLPVASGIGGGSADAAAVLRLLRDTHPSVAGLDLAAIASRLGADIPVCLRSRAALMTGIGECVEAISLPEGLYAILANPLIEVPKDKTAQVFRLLKASPIAAQPNQTAPAFSSAADVIAYAAARRNDLEPPSRKLFPAVDVLLDELSRLAGARLARLSGAGPTCFALFTSADAASAAVAALQSRYPDWWIKPSRLV